MIFISETSLPGLIFKCCPVVYQEELDNTYLYHLPINHPSQHFLSVFHCIRPLSNVQPDTSALISLTRNLTDCGISPVLNHTLLGSTASQNATTYLAFTNATIWSWLPSEPRNTSGLPNERCASTSPLGQVSPINTKPHPSLFNKYFMYCTHSPKIFLGDGFSHPSRQLFRENYTNSLPTS